MTSGKHGVNLGTDNAPSNYLDIVIPTGATNYTISVANTFGGASVATVQGLNCTQSNVQSLLTNKHSLE